MHFQDVFINKNIQYIEQNRQFCKITNKQLIRSRLHRHYYRHYIIIIVYKLTIIMIIHYNDTIKFIFIYLV